MKHRILPLVSALLVVGGVMVTGTAQQAGASQELNLAATSTNFVFIPAGGTPTANPSPSEVPNTGDQISARDTISEGGSIVGFDTILCTDTFNDNGMCTDVISINNVGDIHVTALVRGVFDFSGNGPATFDASIDGGTFAYAHATGYMHGADVSDTVTDYTLFIN